MGHMICTFIPTGNVTGKETRRERQEFSMPGNRRRVLMRTILTIGIVLVVSILFVIDFSRDTQTVNIHANEFSFKPSSQRVTMRKVQFLIRNEGRVSHAFAVEGIDMRLFTSNRVKRAGSR